MGMEESNLRETIKDLAIGNDNSKKLGWNSKTRRLVLGEEDKDPDKSTIIIPEDATLG